jgi:predicted dehydrogenase
MTEQSEKVPGADFSRLSRRDFMVAGTAAGAGLVAAPSIVRSETLKNDTVNIGMIGVGAQGLVQLKACLKIPGVQFKAVCDIWDYSQRYASRYLKKYKHDVNVYTDYQEMLANEPDLDAVLIATPDWMHHTHANACMEAGKHVYCEKMMSNTVEAAASMVRTQRKTGKLLQIGHQRRSNPRYIHAHDKLIKEANVFGRLTHANAQWNRGKRDDFGYPEKYAIPEDILNKYGYEDMHQFRNWRWFKKYGGGPLSDLGAHQIDIFNWFFGTTPSACMAMGGVDFYKKHEWYDNVMVLYEYQTDAGVARAFYQVLTTTSSLGFNERFMGIEGTLSISENPKWNHAYREAYAPKWDEWTAKGYLYKEPKQEEEDQVLVDARETAALDAYDIPVELKKYIHQPHLENFFDAVRKGTPLNCPAEVGFRTCVTVKKVNKAIESLSRVEFKPEDFQVT